LRLNEFPHLLLKSCKDGMLKLDARRVEAVVVDPQHVTLAFGGINVLYDIIHATSSRIKSCLLVVQEKSKCFFCC